MINAELSERTVSRLQKIAIPLQDTYDTVIARLLDEFEARQVDKPKKSGEPLKTEGNVMFFDPHSPPPLGFTTLTQVVLNGEQFAKSDTYWNKVMNRVILEAGKRGHDADAIFKMLTVNAFVGEKTDNGYVYLSEVGLSVQGQDSNAAFRQAFQLAEAMGFKLTVVFYWQDNEKAAYPNQRGAFEI
jgi:hypothetical protein